MATRAELVRHIEPYLRSMSAGSLVDPGLTTANWLVVLEALRAPTEDQVARRVRRECLAAVRDCVVEAPTNSESDMMTRFEHAIREI